MVFLNKFRYVTYIKNLGSDSTEIYEILKYGLHFYGNTLKSTYRVGVSHNKLYFLQRGALQGRYSVWNESYICVIFIDPREKFHSTNLFENIIIFRRYTHIIRVHSFTEKGHDALLTMYGLNLQNSHIEIAGNSFIYLVGYLLTLSRQKSNYRTGSTILIIYHKSTI